MRGPEQVQGGAMRPFLITAACFAISSVTTFAFQAPSRKSGARAGEQVLRLLSQREAKDRRAGVGSPRTGSHSDSQETWEKVIAKLRSRVMPPPKLPRPDNATYDYVASWLESEIDRAAAAHVNPGRTASLHRLNRAEYANAVRDLMAVEVDPQALLPPDEQAFGFENNAEALSMQPALLDRYISAAASIARRAVGDSTIPAGFVRYGAMKDNANDADLSSPGGSSGRRLSAGIQRRCLREPLFPGGWRLCLQASSAAGVGQCHPRPERCKPNLKFAWMESAFGRPRWAERNRRQRPLSMTATKLCRCACREGRPARGDGDHAQNRRCGAGGPWSGPPSAFQPRI